MESNLFFKSKLIVKLLSVSVVVLWVASAVAADEELDEARARIAQLEEDVRQLRTERSVTPLISGLPPSPDEPEEEESEEERKLGSLVQKYMRRMSEQAPPVPSPRDPDQDNRLSAVEDKLNGIVTKLTNGKTANAIFGNDGLFFTSNDGNFKMRFGGTFQFDAIGMGPASSGVTVPQPYGLQDSVEFRRLRFRTEGTMWHDIDYVSEFDFAIALQNTSPGIPGVNNSSNPDNGLQATTSNGGNGIQSGNTQSVVQPTTIFATVREVPVLGNVRIGNQQNWLSMEHIESARFTDFMERAPIMDAFSGPNNNGYAPGVSFYDSSEDKNFGWQAGIYKNNAYDSGFTFNMGDGWMYGGRLIWTPYYDEESNGKYLIHTGIGSEYRQFNSQINPANQGANIRIRSRGDLRNAVSTLDPNYADTGNFFVEGQTLINPEVAVQLGPLVLQSEYVASFLQGARAFQTAPTLLGNDGNLFMQGGYVQALYFLTGESRSYNRQSGVFGRTIPKENLKFSDCKYGAWQVGTRFDWLDLNSGQVSGGRNQNVTVGLNWWLNPNMRFMLNYVCGFVQNSAGTYHLGNGTLVGSKFLGDGTVQSIGARMDVSY